MTGVAETPYIYGAGVIEKWIFEEFPIIVLSDYFFLVP